MEDRTQALKAAMEKTAGFFGTVSAAGKTIGSGLNSAKIDDVATAAKLSGGLAAAAVIGGWGIKKVIDKISNDYKRKALLEDLILNDPILKQEDPNRVKEYYATIYMAAPDISADKSVVRELLRTFVKFGRVDINSINLLVDTQQKYIKGNEPGKLPLGFK